jgi:hypothetical protein
MELGAEGREAKVQGSRLKVQGFTAGMMEYWNGGKVQWH